MEEMGSWLSAGSFLESPTSIADCDTVRPLTSGARLALCPTTRHWPAHAYHCRQHVPRCALRRAARRPTHKDAGLAAGVLLLVGNAWGLVYCAVRMNATSASISASESPFAAQAGITVPVRPLAMVSW